MALAAGGSGSFLLLTFSILHMWYHCKFHFMYEMTFLCSTLLRNKLLCPTYACVCVPMHICVYFSKCSSSVLHLLLLHGNRLRMWHVSVNHTFSHYWLTFKVHVLLLIFLYTDVTIQQYNCIFMCSNLAGLRNILYPLSEHYIHTTYTYNIYTTLYLKQNTRHCWGFLVAGSKWLHKLAKVIWDCQNEAISLSGLVL